MSHAYQRPQGVLDAEAVRAFRAECDLFRLHEWVWNEASAVQRRAQMGISTPGDEALHRNLMDQRDRIETAIAAQEAEEGAAMSERLEALVASFQQEIDRRATQAEISRLTRAIADALAARVA